MYMSLQGRVEIAKLNATGQPEKWRWVGNVPEYSIGSDVSKLEHKEAYSGQKAKDLILITELNSTLTINLEDFQKENMQLAFRGSSVTTAAGNIVDEVVPGAKLAGDRIATLYGNISTVVIKDSAGSPATVPPAQYEIEDAAFGMIKLKPSFVVGTLVFPLKVSYANGAAEQISFFTEGAGYYAVRLNGVNLADGNKPVMVEYYKVDLSPASEVSWITDELASFPLEGTALVDATKPAVGPLGQIGRIVFLA